MRNSLFAFAFAALSFAAVADEPATALFNATLWDSNDKPVALEKYKGKALIVNFWARWCGPCRSEIPELAKLRAARKAQGLEVIGIGIEDNAEPVREFAKAYDMDYPVLIAKEKGLSLMSALGNSKGGLPFTVTIDRNGNIVGRKMGLMKSADLDAAAEQILRK